MRRHYIPLGGRYRKHALSRAGRPYRESQSGKSQASANRFGSDARRIAGKMFSHKPLTKLSPEDLSALRKQAREMIAHRLNNVVADLGMVAANERRQAVIERFNKGVQGSRNANTAYGSGIFGISDRLVEKFGRIRVLDVGAGQGHTLADFKKRYADRVETHSISYEDEPTGADLQHVFDAAYFPRQFRKKFHLIISNIAIRYMLMPNLVIENCVKALAVGGHAELHLTPFAQGDASRFLGKEAQFEIARTRLRRKYPIQYLLEIAKSGEAGTFWLSVIGPARILLELAEKGLKDKRTRKEIVGISENARGIGLNFESVASIMRSVETLEEIDRVMFLGKRGALKIEQIEQGREGAIPGSLSFSKLREVSQEDNELWQRHLAMNQKISIREFVNAVSEAMLKNHK